VQGFRRIFSLASQVPAYLSPGRSAVDWEAHDNHLGAYLLKVLGKQAGLCLLAGLVDPFQGDNFAGQAVTENGLFCATDITVRDSTMTHVSLRKRA